MKLQELKHEIELHVLKEEIHIGGEEYIPHIASLAYQSNYIQILWDYGIDVLLMILKILEEYQIYEQCAVIKQVIENTNQLEGTTFPTTYIKDDEQIKR